MFRATGKRTWRFARLGGSGFVLAGLAALLLIAFAGCGSGATSSATTGAAAAAGSEATASAKAAPDFAGPTIDGLDVSLSEYRGKPLVLAFMASW
jgi:hypothetical protein